MPRMSQRGGAAKWEQPETVRSSNREILNGIFPYALKRLER